MCHGLVGIGTIFRVAWGRYWPSSGILWTLKWYWIQLHLIIFHSLKTMLYNVSLYIKDPLLWICNPLHIDLIHIVLRHWKLLLPYLAVHEEHELANISNTIMVKWELSDIKIPFYQYRNAIMIMRWSHNCLIIKIEIPILGKTSHYSAAHTLNWYDTYCRSNKPKSTAV